MWVGMVREEVVGVGVEGFASPSASLGFGLEGANIGLYVFVVRIKIDLIWGEMLMHLCSRRPKGLE